jgi:hypothetical protein
LDLFCLLHGEDGADHNWESKGAGGWELDRRGASAMAGSIWLVVWCALPFTPRLDSSCSVKPVP